MSSRAAAAVLIPILCLAGRRAEPVAVLWHDPGAVEAIDFSVAAGWTPKPRPVPPLRFVREIPTGTSPKVEIADAAGLKWRVKGGAEARVESFATRLVSALGYFAETTWFLAGGQIENAQPLRRPARFLEPGGRFTWAAFELRAPYLDDDWTWTSSPFNGTHELNGLKVLMMLLSNWDNKDARDKKRGSNVGTVEGVVRGQLARVYFVNDWGQSLGAWKGRFTRGTAWDCHAYSAQTEGFVAGENGDYVQFGYRGQHTDDFSNGVRRQDIRWLMQYLGRITDAQVRVGLLVSGASRQEEDCFTSALRNRIEQLRRAASHNTPTAGGRE